MKNKLYSCKIVIKICEKYMPTEIEIKQKLLKLKELHRRFSILVYDAHFHGIDFLSKHKKEINDEYEVQCKNLVHLLNTLEEKLDDE